MKATIEKINGKWTVNGKPHSEMSMLEIGLLNEFFADFNLTTNQRCKKFCNCKINELLVDCEIVEPTKVFDKAMQEPIVKGCPFDEPLKYSEKDN